MIPSILHSFRFSSLPFSYSQFFFFQIFYDIDVVYDNDDNARNERSPVKVSFLSYQFAIFNRKIIFNYIHRWRVIDLLPFC